MKEYLRLFTSHSDYNTAKSSLDKPNVSYCNLENEVHYNPWTYAEAYLTFVALEDGTFQLSTNTISYSLDNGETWTELAANTASPTITAGNKIMWKGELIPSSGAGVGIFSATGNFDVQGNVMSLLFGDNYKGQTDLTGKNYAFYLLFKNNTKVVSAENLSLPATILANSCYNYMFYGCTNLVTAPALPATTLANNCYDNMFYGCTSLTTAPALPATTLVEECYNGMFQGCTSLTTAPALPATTLKISCYNKMFYNCTSLTTAPELPATTLANNCYYNMFYGCTSLTTAPELPATTLTRGSCYQNMFYGCTSLTTAPELPATTLGNNCYYGMFQNCTSLTSAPELPATTLAANCYYNMFYGCTSLTTAPELPAATLVQYCYNQMFRGCSNLNYIKAMFTTKPSTSYTKDWVSGVAASGTFVKNAAATWNVSGVNGIPTGWTVQTASE